MIPKIIHYCWFGRNPKPKLAEKCIRSWKKYCPDYEIIEWNEDNFDIRSNLYVQEAYDAKKWAFVTDYVRLWAIYTMGGVYMDTDVELVGKIDRFLVHKAFSGFESPEYVPTGIMAGEKENPLYGELLEYYANRHLKLEDGSLYPLTNTKIITYIMKEKGLKCNNIYQEIEGFALYPTDYFCPISTRTGVLSKTKNTTAIHYFNASWRLPKDREKRKLWQQKQRLEHLRYAPNRMIRKLFGDEKVDRFKRFLGK